MGSLKNENNSLEIIISELSADKDIRRNQIQSLTQLNVSLEDGARGQCRRRWSHRWQR
jgi:hypothetical protein